MKKLILALAVCLTTASTFAQDMKPVSGDMGFTFGASGIATMGVSTPNPTGSLLFRYYASDNMAARLGINFSNASTTTTPSYMPGVSQTTNVTKSSSWGLSLGAQHDFTGSDRITTYLGADLVLGSGGGSSDMLTESIDTNGVVTTGATSFSTDVSTKNGSTFSFGIIPCVGFEYFLNDWFSVGAEFGWGFTSTSVKDGTTTTTSTVGGTTSAPVISTSKGMKSSGLGTIGSGMVTVSVYFEK